MAVSLSAAQGSVNRSRRCIESYCRFLKMYRGCLASGSAATSAASRSFQAITSACELTRCATGTGSPSASAERQKTTLSSRASTSSGGRDHEKQCEGSASLSRASYASGSFSGTGTVTKRSTQLEKRDATIQYLSVSTSTTRHPGALPKRRWSRATMAVQVATSGRLTASPASTSIDHRRGSSISAKVLCGGGAMSGVATISTLSELYRSDMDVVGDIHLCAGILAVLAVFMPAVFRSVAMWRCLAFLRSAA